MGLNISKLVEKPQPKELEAPEHINKSIASVDSVDQPQTPTFNALRRLKSLRNSYEKVTDNTSMNNLEGELTPNKASASRLKQRLIKALGGYNILDPRSPNQFIARTPICLKNVPQPGDMFETTLDESFKVDEDPYHIFEEENEKFAVAKTEVCEDLKTLDPRSPTEGVSRTPLVLPEQPEVAESENKANPSKPVENKSGSQALIKSIYKDLIRRDPIYCDLMEDADEESGKTTPIKKATTNEVRTPLSCLGNKRLFNKNTQKNEFADNFVDKIERTTPNMAIITDENTPVGQGVLVGKALTLSKSRIPIRARRL